MLCGITAVGLGFGFCAVCACWTHYDSRDMQMSTRTQKTRKIDRILNNNEWNGEINTYATSWHITMHIDPRSTIHRSYLCPLILLLWLVQIDVCFPLMIRSYLVPCGFKSEKSFYLPFLEVFPLINAIMHQFSIASQICRSIYWFWSATILWLCYKRNSIWFSI